MARAERGLWNGGQLLGYDLDREHKGFLLPNPEEAALVNFAFDSYLKSGSIKSTRDALNSRGYRTKAYKSRRGTMHQGAEFNFTSVQFLLKNPAYVGKKIIGRRPEARLVLAVWPGIVEPRKFDEVQSLLAVNSRTKHNGFKSVRHAYVLSAGLLHCGLCSGAMEGRSGTGRLGVAYFYYVCRKEGCGLRISADEIEGAVLDRLTMLARDEALLDAVAEQTNARLQKQAPTLLVRKQQLERKLATVKQEAEGLLANWQSLEGQAGREFFTGRLNVLAQQRADLEHGIVEAERALLSLSNDGVEASRVREALSRFSELYQHLKPYEQKELFHLVLQRAEVHPRKVILEINGNVPGLGTLETGASHPGIPNWLPGLISQSVFRDVFDASLSSLSSWVRRSRKKRRPSVLVPEWTKQLDEASGSSRAALARREGLSRARVTQLLGPA